MERRWPDRDEVREATDCPRCGAKAGWNCIGVRGKARASNHVERVDAAQSIKARERSTRAMQAIDAVRAAQGLPALPSPIHPESGLRSESQIADGAADEADDFMDAMDELDRDVTWTD
jgi:hypothetical protein